MKNYDHKAIEKKWQKNWAEKNVYKTEDKVTGKENEYILVEFPYPSGNLHVGHWYAFAITDIFAKYRRMLGKNVLFPIGFDAFGLPAENAAIKRNLNPREWTYSNIEFMKNQLTSMGASFDWERLLITCSPEYYKWTEWLFLKFFEKGLAYQSETNVNWCPSCKTVLANEQVISGKCERCGTEVIQKKMNQWQFKITDYADRLIDDLDNLNWPHAIKESQRNWIGRSQGSLVPFKIKFLDKGETQETLPFEVFTTRADTLFGVTYVVLAPESELVKKILPKIYNQAEAEKYIEQTIKKTEMDRLANLKDKTGIKLEGICAVNPANNEEIPVFISDYVLANYGTGAIMAVPAHDERDFEFAKKFNLRVKTLITEEGILIDSGEYNNLSSQEAKLKITEKVSGKITNNYRLRDWLISRQRYWGCPIPIIHCAQCGNVPVPEEDLPVILPEISDYLPSEDGKSPLSKVSDWVNVSCPKCGQPAKRETDTLDTFIDSSWYFLRYLDPKNNENFSDIEKQANWMPVNFYSGGSEHTTMHLLFARFFQKVLFDLGLTKWSEPFSERLNRGLILGPDGNKMSKSKGNVIDPDEIVEKLGADTVRGYLAFIGPYNEPGSYPWDPNGVVGIRRFIERLIKIETQEETSKEVKKELNKTIKKVSEDYQKLKFNTALAQLMIMINVIEKGSISKADYATLLKLAFPIFPHITEELYSQLGFDNQSFLANAEWPSAEMVDDLAESYTLVVQIDGRVRAKIEVSNNLTEAEIKKIVVENAEVRRWLEGKSIEKTIFVAGKLFNIVTVDIPLT